VETGFRKRPRTNKKIDSATNEFCMKDSFPAIDTPRLSLRCVEERDAEHLSALMSPGVSRWVASWTSPLPVDKARALIARARIAAAEGKALPMIVERKSDGAVVGWIAVNGGPETRGTFGYWLGEAFHGQGFMREAAPIALAHGFQRLGLVLIGAGAQLDNAASLAVMKACGMRHIDDRMIYAPSRERDELCAWYEITAAEFAARQKTES
jgi:RimJ/RimL family protein N-acetyltransferase